MQTSPISTQCARAVYAIWDTAARIDIIRSSVWHVIMSAHLLFRSSFLQVSLEITGRQLRSRAPGARIRRRRRHDSRSSARYWDTHTHTHTHTHTQQRDKEPLDDATDREETRLQMDGWHWICEINLSLTRVQMHSTRLNMISVIMTRRRSHSGKYRRYLVESIIVRL